MYDVDHDDATTAAKALTAFVASSSFTECLRHGGGRGDAAHGALVAAARRYLAPAPQPGRRETSTWTRSCGA